MSRLAKRPIAIPPKTEVSFSGGTLTVKGPLGSLARIMPDGLTVALSAGSAVVSAAGPDENTGAALGTAVAHLKNMIAGVNRLFEKKMVMEGIGFKADVKAPSAAGQGGQLVLSVGFSHTVGIPVPADIKVAVEKSGISISGLDREKVGKFAAEIRAVKKPEPYLGKGIRYADEVIRRKQGKKAA